MKLIRPKAADEERLIRAGFALVIRWVDLSDPTGATLKTIEALTLLDRRAEAQTKPQAKKTKAR